MSPDYNHRADQRPCWLWTVRECYREVEAAEMGESQTKKLACQLLGYSDDRHWALMGVDGRRSDIHRIQVTL
jgi:hypothetical protein